MSDNVQGDGGFIINVVKNHSSGCRSRKFIFDTRTRLVEHRLTATMHLHGKEHRWVSMHCNDPDCSAEVHVSAGHLEQEVQEILSQER